MSAIVTGISYLKRDIARTTAIRDDAVAELAELEARIMQLQAGIKQAESVLESYNTTLKALELHNG